MIRSITEQSGATVDIDDDGTVRVFGQDQAARDKAVAMIEEITAEAEVGAVYTDASSASSTSAPSSISSRARTVCCTSRRSPTSGSRMCPITSPRATRCKVKVLDVDQRGRIKLSIKEETRLRHRASVTRALRRSCNAEVPVHPAWNDLEKGRCGALFCARLRDSKGGRSGRSTSRRVRQRRERAGVPEAVDLVLGDLAQDAAHDLARAGLRQARRPLDDVSDLGDRADLRLTHAERVFSPSLDFGLRGRRSGSTPSIGVT
jgi:hypothetical protein